MWPLETRIYRLGFKRLQVLNIPPRVLNGHHLAFNSWAIDLQQPLERPRHRNLPQAITSSEHLICSVSLIISITQSVSSRADASLTQHWHWSVVVSLRFTTFLECSIFRLPRYCLIELARDRCLMPFLTSPPIREATLQVHGCLRPVFLIWCCRKF